MNLIFSVPPAHKPTYTAIDTEWFKMEKNKLHRPTTGVFACLQICYDIDTVYIVTDQKDVPLALDRIKDDIWVMHNAKFDITHLRRLAPVPPRKKLWDIMAVERIAYGGYYEFFSLKAMARRYLQVVLDKESRELFEKADRLSDKMIEYSAQDAVVTLRILYEQMKVVSETDISTIWHKIDRPVMFALLDFIGFRIDGRKWLDLYELNNKRATELEAKLPYNPRSRKKAKQLLIENGFKDLKSTDEKELLRAIKKYPKTKAAEYATLSLEVSKYYTRAHKYGKAMYENFREVDPESPGCFVICANYNVSGAETGRTSSDSPNMQNIPWRDTKEFRECFIARPGHKLVIGDYSAQEPRILAYLSKDPNLIKIFQEGKDIYIEMAFLMFGEHITKDDPRRGQMKAVVLGMSYGLSKYGLAKREGISVDEAERLLDLAWKKFPVAKQYMDKQKRAKNYVTTVAGRKSYLNRYSNQADNNALNAPVQGTAGDMMKMAIIKMHEQWNYDAWGRFAQVEETHDEVGADVPEEVSKEVAQFMAMCMESVGNEMCPGVPFVADVHIGDSWADK